MTYNDMISTAKVLKKIDAHEFKFNITIKNKFKMSVIKKEA
jgi:hypothetical protein